MHLRKFLCCVPLKYGTMTVGAVFGIFNLVTGGIGFNMVIANEYPDDVVEFFRTMDTQTCIAGFSTLLWLLMIDHFLLIYAAIYMAGWSQEPCCSATP
ncbi:uncharacterized protein LOC108093906 isoform X2 [Drosophila ficusphila]|uniref:uncharacterized protein LOC108093906 isoform X2 n=1 Tax=Drosophila ficusphila TaxID=30025 RepID=UPI0007E74CD3|nr:uncharacterized protein LOC108093906 isoform X2 [Drosophila ficusphila]